MQGVIRGLNLQSEASWATLFSYWLLGIPLGLLLAFSFDFGMTGLRLGLIVAQTCLITFYTFLIYVHTNWDQAWQSAQQRLSQDLKDIRNDEASKP